MAKRHLRIDPGSCQMSFVLIGQISGIPGWSNPNVPFSHLLPPDVRMPIRYNAMPYQLPQQTKFIRTMDRPDMQASRNTELNPTQVTEVKNSLTDNSSKNSTEKNKLRKRPRQVQVPTFDTRRHELMQSNKPYYSYEPTILKTWQESDFLKHKDLFQKLDPKNADKEEHEEISLDVSQLIKGRSIIFKPLNMEPLKQSMKAVQRKDRWWIVADTKALLHDLRFIDRLIKSDPICRMRLPYEVLHDLTAMTAKRHKAWMRMPARRLVKYLETAIDRDRTIIGQSVVQNEDLVDSPVATDAILNCCLQLAKMYYYVVVISDDEERQRRAASVELPCFSLDRVKELVRSSFTDVDNSTKLEITVLRTFGADQTTAGTTNRV